MNNGNNNNTSPSSGNIDDILDILQKRKSQDIMEGKAVEAEPTRVDHQIVKTPAPSQPEAKNGQVPAPKAEVKDEGVKTYTPPVKPAAPVQNPAAASSNLTQQVPSAHLSKPAAPASSNVKSSPAGTPSMHNGGGISLSDFDSKEYEKQSRIKGKGKGFSFPGWLKVILYLVIVVGVSVFLSITAIKVGNDVFAFVKADDEITVEIPKDATLKDVAQILHQSGVIAYPSVFEMYGKDKIKDSYYLTDEFTEGSHIVTPMMNYDKLLSALCVSSYDKSVVRITIPEGLDFPDILDLFEENGVLSADAREENIKQLQEFEYDYDFMTKLTEEGSLDRENRKYRFEGYLFPDTYDFYKNENPISAIDKLLSNFDKKFSDEMYERTKELGMTVDEVITLASIIEAEGDSPSNFAKISSVFHNRLKDKSGKFMFLNSDATTLYAYKVAGQDKKVLSGGDTDFEHPYNTYSVKGLPPGPICNPGMEAIYAALYPDTTNYYYFLTMANGETVFARTESQHLNNIARSNRLAAEMAQ